MARTRDGSFLMTLRAFIVILAKVLNSELSGGTKGKLFVGVSCFFFYVCTVSAESVYAVFECKQKISKENIEYANDKIDSVRKLHRGKREIVFGGKSMKSRELTKIIGDILAANAVGLDTLKNHLAENKNIDLGCAIKEYSFLARRDIKQNLTGCINSSKEEAILSFFYIILDELYKIGTVAALDIRDYANASLTSLQLEREEE